MRDDGVTKYLLSYFGKRTDDVKTLQFYGNVCVDYGLNMILFTCICMLLTFLFYFSMLW